MCKLATNYIDCEHENKLGKMPRYSTLRNYSLTPRGRFPEMLFGPFQTLYPDNQLSSRNFLPGSIRFLEKQDRETTNTFKPSNVRVSQNNLAYSISS